MNVTQDVLVTVRDGMSPLDVHRTPNEETQTIDDRPTPKNKVIQEQDKEEGSDDERNQ